MTIYEVVSLIVWTISSIAVIYSLYQVNRQTRIFARQTEYVARSLIDSKMESLFDQSHEISRLFVTYPGLRPYFYEGQPIDRKNPDYHRAEAVAELLLDIFYSMSQQAQERELRAATSNEGVQLWQDYIEDAFAQSPILVQTLTKRQSWYGQEMVDQMKTGIERHASGPHAESHH